MICQAIFLQKNRINLLRLLSSRPILLNMLHLESVLLSFEVANLSAFSSLRREQKNQSQLIVLVIRCNSSASLHCCQQTVTSGHLCSVFCEFMEFGNLRKEHNVRTQCMRQDETVAINLLFETKLTLSKDTTTKKKY